MSKNGTQGGGIGVMGLLGIVFVTLKLTGIINWSWWWVTLPFWGGLALMLAIGLIIFTACVISDVLTERKIERNRRRRK
ncbi:hypothetical protein [Brevibacillus reuszeri]|uniref:hypothetical protein n=1 Tax=Brevibacillus reuszeri TaxID=54915 RepID=UPI000CCC1ECE|nr:hypothetical protein [Brevibacillus reuszeri]